MPARTAQIAPGNELIQALRPASGQIDAALADFDFRSALRALLTVAAEGNRVVEATRPWELATAEQGGDHRAGARLSATLATLVTTCRWLASELEPVLPAAAARLQQRCAPAPDRVARPEPAFPRIER